MPLIAIVLLGLLVVMVIAISLSFTLLHMLTTVAVAGFVGWLADQVVPGELPFGWLGAVVAGLLGGWLGNAIIGGFGPGLFGVQLVPTFVGAAILAAGYELVGKNLVRRS